MALARELADLERLIRERGIDPFAPLEKGGLLDQPEVLALTSALKSLDAHSPASVVRLCLQALQIQAAEVAPRLLDVELVATLPSDVPGLARSTSQVVRDMLRRARGEVILLGYELTDDTLMQQLAEAARCGAQVIVISDRQHGAARRLRDAWPPQLPMPRLYQDRNQFSHAPYGSMHAKCLLVDGHDLLVTSANFTFHGLHGNIEIGVRLAGPPAQEARDIFSYLVESLIVEEYGP